MWVWAHRECLCTESRIFLLTINNNTYTTYKILTEGGRQVNYTKPAFFFISFRLHTAVGIFSLFK